MVKTMMAEVLNAFVTVGSTRKTIYCMHKNFHLHFFSCN